MRWASYLIRIYARKLADQRWNNTGDGDIRSGERLERRLCRHFLRKVVERYCTQPSPPYKGGVNLITFRI